MPLTWASLEDSIPPLNLLNFPAWQVLSEKKLEKDMPSMKQETTIKVILTLTEEEAKWLSNYLQNAVCEPKVEPLQDRNMRKAFFDSLNPPRCSK
jgi:hypothetical protein